MNITGCFPFQRTLHPNGYPWFSIVLWNLVECILFAVCCIAMPFALRQAGFGLGVMLVLIVTLMTGSVQHGLFAGAIVAVVCPSMTPACGSCCDQS